MVHSLAGILPRSSASRLQSEDEEGGLVGQQGPCMQESPPGPSLGNRGAPSRSPKAWELTALLGPGEPPSAPAFLRPR